MGREHLHFGGGVSQTILHPLVLVAVLIAGFLICVSSRRTAITAFLFAAILIPTDQVLLIAWAHFSMLRVLLLFGIVRIIREKMSSGARLFSGHINKIDVAVILLTFFTAVNGMLLFPESGAVINQLGSLYTLFGMYFLLRCLIRDQADVMRAIQTLACIAAIVAAVMTYECATGHNPYAILEGAAASKYGDLVARGERFRAQGPFAHSILAGTFGAVSFPLFVALWCKAKKYRRMAALGILSSAVITYASNSSTPVLGYVAGVLAVCLWPARQWLRALRWGTVLMLALLHLVMRGPVWSLIEKVDVTGSSSGWHRYMLVDQCIRRFGDWWLFGVKDTSVWGWDMWDTANQYVSVCENSGFLPFVLFLAVIIYGFKYLGSARQAAETDKRTALFLWALGAALFANVVEFFGVSYFDQTIVAWYTLLAMIPAAAMSVRLKTSLSPISITPPALDAEFISQPAR